MIATKVLIKIKPLDNKENNIMMKTIFLLTNGDGSDGDEWSIISVHSTLELATIAKEKYEGPIMQFDGSTYNYEAQIQEWEVDESNNAFSTTLDLPATNGEPQDHTH